MYKHWEDEEKEFIRISLFYQKSLREIARHIKRDVATISREIKKNSSGGIYLPKTNFKKPRVTKRRPRITDNPIIREYLIENNANKIF